MNYIRLAIRIWITYAIAILIILFIDGAVAIALAAFTAIAGIGWGVGLGIYSRSELVGGLIAMIVSFTSFPVGGYAAYKFAKWLDMRTRRLAVDKLRKLGFNANPKDLGFLAHRYYLMLLPTPEIEEEFSRRLDEVSTRYNAAVTTAFYAYIIYNLFNIMLIFINLVVILAVMGKIEYILLSPAPLVILFLIGVFNGWVYAREELKTVVLRRPETTMVDVRKALNAIAQGILDVVLF